MASDPGVVQPIIRRFLSDLEKSLGFQLFDRREGWWAPTQEIPYLQPSAERVLELMRRILDVGQNILRRKAGHIRVACLTGFAASHLPSVVAGFLKDRSGVTMTIEPDRPGCILEWLIGEQYDFGITGGFNGRPAIESNNIEVRSVCVFPTGHELENLSEVTPADIADDKIIHTRHNCDILGRVLIVFQNANVEPNADIEVRQFTVACKLAVQGVGVSVVSELDAVQ